jgi:hypothetical protein
MTEVPTIRQECQQCADSYDVELCLVYDGPDTDSTWSWLRKHLCRECRKDERHEPLAVFPNAHHGDFTGPSHRYCAFCEDEVDSIEFVANHEGAH